MNRYNAFTAALAVATGLAAAALAEPPAAHADGILSDVEAVYVLAYGASAVCPVLSRYPSEGGVAGIRDGIMADGFASDSAIDIINASVSEYCPRHWGLLVAIGDKYRAITGAHMVAVDGAMGGRVA